jgi:hypothetical protein
MNAPTNPKATPRSSERFKEVVAQPLLAVLCAFFVEDVVAQPFLAVLFGLFVEDSDAKPATEVLQDFF